jgi:hypothetical protein
MTILLYSFNHGMRALKSKIFVTSSSDLSRAALTIARRPKNAAKAVVRTASIPITTAIVSLRLSCPPPPVPPVLADAPVVIEVTFTVTVTIEIVDAVVGME